MVLSYYAYMMMLFIKVTVNARNKMTSNRGMRRTPILNVRTSIHVSTCHHFSGENTSAMTN